MSKGRKINKRLDARRRDYDQMLSRGEPRGVTYSYISKKSGRAAFHRPGSNSK